MSKLNNFELSCRLPKYYYKDSVERMFDNKPLGHQQGWCWDIMCLVRVDKGRERMVFSFNQDDVRYILSKQIFPTPKITYKEWMYMYGDGSVDGWVDRRWNNDTLLTEKLEERYFYDFIETNGLVMEKGWETTFIFKSIIRECLVEIIEETYDEVKKELKEMYNV